MIGERSLHSRFAGTWEALVQHLNDRFESDEEQGQFDRELELDDAPDR